MHNKQLTLEWDERKYLLLLICCLELDQVQFDFLPSYGVLSQSLTCFPSDQKRTWEGAPLMSALGQKQTFEVPSEMSALPPRADILPGGFDVRYVPKADIWLVTRLLSDITEIVVVEERIVVRVAVPSVLGESCNLLSFVVTAQVCN